MRHRPTHPSSIGTTLATALLATVLGLAPAATADPTSTPTVAAPTTPAPGSYVVLVSRGKRVDHGISTRQQRLEVVSASGERRVVLSVPVRRNSDGLLSLADVSTDGTTVLLTTATGRRRADTRAIAVDLATGAQRSVVVSSDHTVSFLAPDGGGVIVSGYGKKGYPVARVGFDGLLTPFAAKVGGRMIVVDATTVLGQTPGRRQLSVDAINLTTGTVSRRYPTPGLTCDPVRSVALSGGTAAGVLLSCYTAKLSRQVLRTLDPTTGALTVVTDRHPKSHKFYGDLDARSLAGTLYVQVAGPCGYVDVARQESTGRLVHVDVPGAEGSVLLVGTTATELVLEHAYSCDGGHPTAVLARLDPATGVETPIVTLPGKEVFDRVVPLGETQAAIL